jgi:hypothetical protein
MWRARRAEQENEILNGACRNVDLSMEDVVQAIQDFNGGHAVVSAVTGGEEVEEVAETPRRRAGTSAVGRPPGHRLRLFSLTRPRCWGTARILSGRIHACRWKGSFTTPRGSVSVATGSSIPVRHQTIVKPVRGTRWRETGRVVPQVGVVRFGPKWRWRCAILGGGGTSLRGLGGVGGRGMRDDVRQ